MSGLVSALYTGVTGLTGNSQALEVLGDNISNVNTVGFKGSKPVFTDVLSTILNNGATTSQIGRGTQMQGVQQNFAQGAFEASNNALDLAIDGSGFFIVNNGAGNVYTRAGQFRLNDAGHVATSTGEILQGYDIANGVTATELSNADLAGVQSPPKATTNFTAGTNLNAAASAGTTFSTPITAYNSVGTEVILSIAFTKQSGSNAWGFSVTPSSGTMTAGASGVVTFGTSGALLSISDNATGTTGSTTNPTMTLDFSTSNPPALGQTITWDLFTSDVTNGKLTGFAAQSNNNSLVQDGFGTGTLIGLNVGSTGIIQGLFNNGQTENLFQVALADFLAATGLTKQGNNTFAESASSGQPVIGHPLTGGFGSILDSTLELSNVDLATEFVALIQSQQAFQAAARIINTTDDLLTETVNLVR